MSNNGGCLEANLEEKITIEANLDEGHATAEIDPDQNLSATLEPQMEIIGRLGRCWQEEAP